MGDRYPLMTDAGRRTEACTLWCGSLPDFLCGRIKGEAVAPSGLKTKSQLCRQHCQGSLSYISHNRLNAGFDRTDRSLLHGHLWLTPIHRCPTLHKASEGWQQDLCSCAVCHMRRRKHVVLMRCTLAAAVLGLAAQSGGAQRTTMVGVNTGV